MIPPPAATSMSPDLVRTLHVLWGHLSPHEPDLVWFETKDGLLLRDGGTPAARFFSRGKGKRLPPPAVGTPLTTVEERTRGRRQAVPEVVLRWPTGFPAHPEGEARCDVIPARECPRHRGIERFAIQSTPEIEPSKGAPRAWETARLVGPLVGPVWEAGSFASWLYTVYTVITFTSNAPVIPWEGSWPAFRTTP